MRFLRFAVGVPIALGTLSLGTLAMVSAPASATTATVPTQLSVGQAELGRLGIFISVPLRFTCDPSLNVAFGDVTVVQVTGHKLAQGAGSFLNNFPGVPCTGAPEKVVVQVPASGSFAFRVGDHAFANADLSVFDPVSGNLSTVSVKLHPLTISR